MSGILLGIVGLEIFYEAWMAWGSLSVTCRTTLASLGCLSCCPEGEAPGVSQC